MENLYKYIPSLTKTARMTRTYVKVRMVLASIHFLMADIMDMKNAKGK